MKNYNPRDYWEKCLSKRFELSGVGHAGFSEYYNKWLYKAKIRTLKKALLSQQIDIHDKIVCDIGCGTGFFVDFYHFRGAKDIVGVDITSISIKNLKRKYSEYHFIKEDISSSSLVSKINRKFDILNVFDILYHIKENKAFRRAIVNISNLTKNKGVIFISDLCGSKSIDVAEHVEFRSRKIYEITLEENGIEIIAICPLYYLLNRPIFGMIKLVGLREIGISLDNLFAPIYYCLDGIFLSSKSNKNNLNLIVAKKVKP